ncbi:hypothetical protein N752_15290 [Desulforamulus aquiferis]|nr:hypothetical protein N752_15290 [Desulforamulus aquiferis]
MLQGLDHMTTNTSANNGLNFFVFQHVGNTTMVVLKAFIG